MAWLNSLNHDEYSPWDRPLGSNWISVPGRPSMAYVFENGEWIIPVLPPVPPVPPSSNPLLHISNGTALEQRMFERLAKTEPVRALLLKEGIE